LRLAVLLAVGAVTVDEAERRELEIALDGREPATPLTRFFVAT